MLLKTIREATTQQPYQTLVTNGLKKIQSDFSLAGGSSKKEVF